MTTSSLGLGRSIALASLAHATHGAVLLALALSPTSALAQATPAVCVEGRVATPETAGRCCWPGQAWSTAYGRCEGPPGCPAGLVADGDECVRASAGPTVVAAMPHGGASAEPGETRPRRGEFAGVHFFLGLTVGGGLSIVSVNPHPAELDGDFLGAIFLGMLAGRFELRLEVAPVSFVPALSRAGGYSIMTTVGGYLHLGGPAYWPLRFGGGLWSAIDRGVPRLQAQADLIGIAFRIDDWMIELNLPTYRFITDMNSNYWYVLSAQFSARYVF